MGEIWAEVTGKRAGETGGKPKKPGQNSQKPLKKPGKLGEKWLQKIVYKIGNLAIFIPMPVVKAAVRKVLHLSVQRIKVPRTSRGFLLLGGGQGPRNVVPCRFSISRRSFGFGGYATTLEAPVSLGLECKEWGTLNIGDNRVVIGLVKRLHLRDELFDPEKKRVNSDHLCRIGRMASPHWYCRTRDRFELIRPE
jgi:hypothetical protein